jgi:hypothetical protein
MGGDMVDRRFGCLSPTCELFSPVKKSMISQWDQVIQRQALPLSRGCRENKIEENKKQRPS